MSCEIALRWIPQDLTDEKSQMVIVWFRQATIHYLNQCWPSFTTRYTVTRPQWDKPGGPLLFSNFCPVPLVIVDIIKFIKKLNISECILWWPCEHCPVPAIGSNPRINQYRRGPSIIISCDNYVSSTFPPLYNFRFRYMDSLHLSYTWNIDDFILPMRKLKCVSMSSVPYLCSFFSFRVM